MSKDVPDSLRLILYDEAGYQCAYCGHRDGLNLTIHHIFHRDEGGTTDYSNLIVLCHNCHHGVHETKKIDAKDVRRIKRHLVQRFFTQIGVNATRIAYAHPLRLAAVAPVQIQHLVDLGYFELDEELEYIGWRDSETDKDHPQLTTLAAFHLTETGIEIAEKWIIKSEYLPKVQDNA
jgi:hypothetical protein